MSVAVGQCRWYVYPRYGFSCLVEWLGLVLVLCDGVGAAVGMMRWDEMGSPFNRWEDVDDHMLVQTVGGQITAAQIIPPQLEQSAHA